MNKILITGGSGLVGSNLSEILTQNGFEVVHLSRNPKSGSAYKSFKWDIKTGYVDEAALQDLYAIIHLAGAGVADKRWSSGRKKLILDSRVKSAELLYSKVKDLDSKPGLFLSASAVGFYGDRGDEKLDEGSVRGDGFLADVCDAWEEAAWKFNQLGIRTAVVRIGLVLSLKGGALAKMITPFRLGVGNYFGDGRQHYPWVHIRDLSMIFKHIVENNELDGVFNGVAPHPVTSKEFSQVLKGVIGGKGLLVSAPASMLKLGLGEMATALLMSTKVYPKKIQDAGFNFQHPELKEALQDLLNKQ